MAGRKFAKKEVVPIGFLCIFQWAPMRGVRMELLDAHDRERRKLSRVCDSDKNSVDSSHQANRSRATSIALERAAKLYGFELSTIGSSPSAYKSCGAVVEVSTARSNYEESANGGR
mgnify:CR=1 FL=1